MKPYYAVIFTSILNKKNPNYEAMSHKMETLAKQQPGFMGMESAKSNLGITVSYWKTKEDIKNWKNHSQHIIAQQMGKEEFYKWYKVRICKIEHEYNFTGM